MSSESHELLFGMKSFFENIEEIDLNDKWCSMTALFRVDGALQVIMSYGDEKSRCEIVEKMRVKLCKMRELTRENEEKGSLSGEVYLDQVKRYDAIKLLEYYVGRFELMECN